MSFAYALVFPPPGGAALRSLRFTAGTELGATAPLSLIGEGVRPRHARILRDRNGDGWSLEPAEGPVAVNGIPVLGARLLRTGDVLALGTATVTFFDETTPPKEPPSCRGNGFSRASRLIAQALDGLPDDERDLLRQLADLEEGLEKAPIAAAARKMAVQDFRAAAAILQGVRFQVRGNAQLLLHLGLCEAKLEQLEAADKTLEEAFQAAADRETKQQALDLRRQVLQARQQKARGALVEEAMQHLQAERFAEATAAFERLPAEVRMEPPVRLMAAVARVKLVLSVPVHPSGRSGVKSILQATLGEVDDVIARAQDEGTRSQARSMKGQLQTLLGQL